MRAAHVENLLDLFINDEFEDEPNLRKNVTYEDNGDSPSGEITFELLNETNYDQWKYYARNHLKKILWECFETRGGVKRRWGEVDKKMREKLLEMIGNPEIKSNVKDYNTSQAMWNKLEIIAAQNKKSLADKLLKQLINYPQMREEQSAALVKNLQDLFQQIQEILSLDATIERRILTTALLRTLPPSFTNYKLTVIKANDWPEPELLGLCQELWVYAKFSEVERQQSAKHIDFKSASSNPNNVNEQTQQVKNPSSHHQVAKLSSSSEQGRSPVKRAYPVPSNSTLPRQNGRLSVDAPPSSKIARISSISSASDLPTELD